VRMPLLQTERLRIRPFVQEDLDAIHTILDIELSDAVMGNEGAQSRVARQRWLDWAILNEEQLAMLNQPPYGDRAVVRKEDDRLIGSCGFTPAFGPFGQVWNADGDEAPTRTAFTPEFGMFWAISPSVQRQGYASEAAKTMLDYALTNLHLQRVVATTTYDNAASIAVMEKLGLRILRNPLPDPPWFQIVGVREGPLSLSSSRLDAKALRDA